MKHLSVMFAFLLAVPAIAAAQAGVTPDALENSLLFDRNGDGLITLAAFGDSNTRGSGDFNSPGENVSLITTPSGQAGYPLRIEGYTGLRVSNWGDPGEKLTVEGERRFIGLVTRNRPDVAIIAEGYNDPRNSVGAGSIYRALQKMINVSRAVGTEPVLTTLIPVCCSHAFLQRFLDTYNPAIRTLAVVNNTQLADQEKAFRNNCASPNCPLLNRPDGLHPNVEGFDVMGEVATAALLNIDIFAPDGATQFAQALNLDPLSVATKPDPLPPSE